MDRVVDLLRRFVGGRRSSAPRTINCHHNYTERETHFGREVWLSRKGAIDGASGQLGPDPGVDGHGVLRRRRARGTVPSLMLLAARRGPEPLPDGGAAGCSRVERPATRGWPASRGATPTPSSTSTPTRTSTIDQVMADAADLVEVRHTLRQIVNVKGN